MLNQAPREPARDTQRAPGHAGEIWIKSVGRIALRVQLLRPRQHDAVQLARLQEALDVAVATARPHAGQVDFAVREFGRRPIDGGGAARTVLTAQTTTKLLRLRDERQRHADHGDGNETTTLSHVNPLGICD